MREFLQKVGVLAALGIGMGQGNVAMVKAADNPSPKPPPAERKITTKEFVNYPPLFARQTKTPDPVEAVRQAWKGYLTNMCEPWGLMPGLQPMLRLYFDDRALPWPSLKPHEVDGPDTNARNVGAHALLHEMLGKEKDNDPVETGQIAYLLSLNPKGTGTPEFVGYNGELVRNVLLLYEQTRIDWQRQWAQKMLTTLRQSTPIESNDPAGGWWQLNVGWNIGAFSKRYEMTGDRGSLDFALAMARRVCQNKDGSGENGSFRPDGSFGGKNQANSGSWHMHGHTHSLPGLLHLGGQLFKAGEKESGLEVLRQAERTFNWLYDPNRNPDAGSMTGWLGEWLMRATGWDRKADCEGCTMGDMVQTATAMGAASRLDPSLAGWVNYYDRAEQIYRGQVIESIFRPTPQYLAIVKDCLQKRVEKNAIGAVTWQDQSGHNNRAKLAVGKALLKTGVFSKKDIPVIRFEGKEYFKLSDSVSLRVPQFSIFAVMKITGGKTQTYYSNYDNPINWGKGINLGITPDRFISFFTTDGTEKNYDPMISKSAVSEGYHIITTTYDSSAKNIYADGFNIGSAASKGLDYGTGTVAAVGALREFEFWFYSDIAEILIYDTVDAAEQAKVENYLSEKYTIPLSSRNDSDSKIKVPLFWLKADVGFVREHPELTPQERQQEVERLYQEALANAGRMEGRLLGLCGFPDWVNNFPSTLDPRLPGIDMMGCCSDAVIRAAHAIWAETVTGDANECRVNLAFNRVSPLVDVISCLPHRGEIDIIAKSAHRVLVRIPEWAPKPEVKLYVEKKSVPLRWNGSYVIFDQVKPLSQLTVTYPLRIAEVKETIGSIDRTEYTEKWRGNTIVDISPPGKWIPMFHRPQLESEQVP
ncbi:MAG: LamG-like jellyroll fold domain-containing protein [Sedimentisphaerales bacterium]|nr:LamG-like jellyroll fold domain-containing protein [Sedimentisphaerales bacterium]